MTAPSLPPAERAGIIRDGIAVGIALGLVPVRRPACPCWLPAVWRCWPAS